jgi:hypothetical protein
MIKRLLQQAGLMLLMMVIGVAFDYPVHLLRPEWNVPPEYFWGKIIFGVIWGVIALYVLRRMLAVTSQRTMALAVPAIVTVVLQTKYFYQGWPLSFVIIFMFLHYLMFLPGSFLNFYRFRDVFTQPMAGMRRRWGLFVTSAIGVEILFYFYFQLFPPSY